MQLSAAAGRSPEKLCASKATYDLIKRELFRRAAQLRGSDQAAYDKLSGYAVIRMENPVMESQDSTTGRGQLLGLAVARPAARRRRRRRPPHPDVRRRLYGPACGRRQRRRRPAAQCRRDHHAAGDAGAGRRARQPPTPAHRRNEIAPARRSECRLRSRPTCRAVRLPPHRFAAARPSFDCANARTQGRDRGLLRQRACRARSSTWPRNIGRAIAGGVARSSAICCAALATASLAIATAAPTGMHRRRLCRADARDPRHHGRPLAPAAISGG